MHQRIKNTNVITNILSEDELEREKIPAVDQEALKNAYQSQVSEFETSETAAYFHITQHNAMRIQT